MAASRVGEQLVPAASTDVSGMEAVPHEGRIFLDQCLVGDTTCQCITDITLVHRQVLSSSRQFCDTVVDEHGKGALSDADGEVVLLEELMVKQLYRDEESLLLYSVSMQANSVTAVEAITDKWTHFTPRDVMVPIDREAIEFPVFIMQHLPMGGQCTILWQISVFFEATQLKGYAGTASKWVFDRWDSWQAIMNNQRFFGTRLFKSTASKKPEDILHSIQCFLPKAAMTTVAMMTLLPRWAYGTVEQGGAKDAKARAIAGNIFKGFAQHAHKGFRIASWL